MEFVGQPGSHSSGPTEARVGPSRAAPGLSRCGSTTFQTTSGCGSLTPLGLVTTLSALFPTWKPLHHNWTKLPLTHENAVNANLYLLTLFTTKWNALFFLLLFTIH